MNLQRVYDAREHDVPYELRTDGFSGATPVRPYRDENGVAYFLTEEEATLRQEAE